MEKLKERNQVLFEEKNELRKGYYEELLAYKSNNTIKLRAENAQILQKEDKISVNLFN